MAQDLSKSDNNTAAIDLTSILKNIPVAAVIIDANKRIIWKNSEYESNFSDEDFSAERTKDNLDITYIPLESGSIEKYLVIFRKKRKGQGEKNLKNLSHDLNNILLSILNSVELLKKKISGETEVEHLLKNIENSTKLAAELTEDAMNKKETQQVIFRKVNVKRLLFELFNSVNQTITKNVVLKKDFEEDINNTNGNYNSLYRVFLNIIVNAKEAIREEGEISLSAKNIFIEEKDNSLMLKSGNFIKISVTDNGQGIDEENIDKIFDEEFSTKNKGRESGFGLNIVKEIVEEHDGKIFVKSKKGKGTTFDVYLPALTGNKKRETKNKKKTILLADDEENLRDLLAELLESQDFSVMHASDGVEVIDKLTESKNIDLLIIDRKMPKMDGLSSIKVVREMNYDLPVLLVSGSPYHGSVEKLRKLKISGVLNKPYEFEKMLEVINDLVES